MGNLREEFVWESCEIEKAEEFLITNQKEHRFNALKVSLRRKWVLPLLGEEVLEEEIVSFSKEKTKKVIKLVQLFKARSPDTSLLTILVHLCALHRDESCAVSKEEMFTIAKEVGLPTEQVPVLKQSVDEFDGAFPRPPDELLNLAEIIERYGNTLEGFELIVIGSEAPAMLPVSSFQQLCSVLRSMKWLGFFSRGLGFNRKLTDAICESTGSAPNLRGLSLEWNGKLSMEALGKVWASPACRLQQLEVCFRRFDITVGVQILSQALQQGQLLLHSLILKENHKDWRRLIGNNLPLLRSEGFRSLAAALQSPGCSLRKLTLSTGGVTTGMESLVSALPSSKIEDLKLLTPTKDINKVYIALGQALQDPTCKLTVLNVTLGRSLRPEAEFPKSFFEGVRTSLTLRSLCLRDTTTLDEQAMLGQSLKDSKLQELECVGFENDDLFQGLLASNVTSLRISYSYNLDKICERILQNPGCKLRSLKLERLDKTDSDVLEQKQALEALDRNYQSCLEHLDMDWSSEAMEKKCSDLLKRNSLFRAVAVSVPDKEPYVAKLFICGPSGAGKTTIKKNITRKSGGVPVPAWLQRHSSTSGIEMHPLAFNKTDKRLLVCDMAGQFEFHAFHHSFLRGIDKSLFLVVVKVDANYNTAVTRDLVYWLRFLASHTSASNSRKPKVFIALNFFHGEVSSPIFRASVLSLTTQNVQDYQAILDIDNDIMEVEATDSRSLQPLKKKLELSLNTLLSQQLKVPGLCEAAKEMCLALKKKQSTKTFKWHTSKRTTHIIEVYKDVGRKLMTQHCSRRADFTEEDQNNIIKFIFLFLHDMGEVVYFERDDSSSQHAVLDVQWFIQDLISLFIDPQKIQASLNNQQQTEHCQGLDHSIVEILSKRCGDDKNKVEFVFQCLYQMGVVIPVGNWSGEWIPLPEKVIVPALSGVSRTYPPFERKQEEHMYRYWGRRLECKDVKFKLFPSGIFAMIQSKVHLQCRNESFRIGSGWITFRADGVVVYLRIGGDTDAWFDRQWVEVMVLVPREDGNTKAVENLMNRMKDCIVEVCFGKLEIGEEKVLSTSYVEFRMHENHGAKFEGAQQLNSRELGVPLSEILKEMGEEGLTYHTWSHSGEDKLSNLLLPSEENRIVRKKTMQLIDVCEDYEKTVKVVYDTPHLSCSIPEIPGDFENKDFKILAAYIRDLARGNQAQLDHMEATLDDIKFRMEKTGKQVLTYSSRILHSINVTCPRYPYLVDADTSKLLKYVQLQRTAKVLYYCECAEGSHPVPNAEGVVLDLPIDWLKKWSSVLIPALVILFMGVKAGARFMGADPVLKAAIDMSKQEIIEFIKSNIGMETLDIEKWKKMKPTEEEIEDVFDVLCKQSKLVTDRETKRMMHKRFGLQWDTVVSAWLCQEHFLE